MTDLEELVLQLASLCFQVDELVGFLEEVLALLGRDVVQVALVLPSMRTSSFCSASDISTAPSWPFGHTRVRALASSYGSGT